MEDADPVAEDGEHEVSSSLRLRFVFASSSSSLRLRFAPSRFVFVDEDVVIAVAPAPDAELGEGAPLEVLDSTGMIPGARNSLAPYDEIAKHARPKHTTFLMCNIVDARAE